MTATLQTGPVFTEDWSGTRNYWDGMFADLRLAGNPGLRFLEVGCFEGRATLWLLENILTDPTSRIDVVDTFTGSPEFDVLNVDRGFRERFESNTASYADQVNVREGRSGEVLRTYPPVPTFDFVYVDGSHYAADVLADAVLAWPLLKVGAMMVFDDYRWGLEGQEEWERPRRGIDAFVSAYLGRLTVRHADYQLVVEKL